MRGRMSLKVVGGLALVGAVVPAGVPASVSAAAGDVVVVSEIDGPAGSEAFGSQVLVLSNGNYVVADPLHDEGGVVDVGAVYLYDGATDTVISKLTGSLVGDKVGSGELVEVGDSNVVVVSPSWGQAGALGQTYRYYGAVTWISGVSGLDGIVSADTSLIDAGGWGDPRITVLTNGSFVVDSKTSFYDGWYTWGAGNSGVSGPMASDTSVRVTSIPTGVVPLANGNYIMRVSDFSDSGTSLIWADGNVGGHIARKGIHGLIHTGDLGLAPILALANGDALVFASGYENNRGAIYRMDGDSGPTDEDVFGGVTESNAIVGTNPLALNFSGDNVGLGAAVELANGDVAVYSRDVVATDGSGRVGAVTIIGADEPTVGVFQDRDLVWGSGGELVALADGGVVLVNPDWDSPTAQDVGLVRRLDVSSPLSGDITDRALIGASTGDRLGSGGVVALSDGGYVVLSPDWDDPDGAVDVGAATWGVSGVGVSGSVTTSNSLVGTVGSSRVGSGGALVLAAGASVVLSPAWSASGDPANGAATYAGSSGVVGPVTTSNSLYGARSGDAVGASGIVLDGGNYLVSSPAWSSGQPSTSQVGAVTRGQGVGGIVGPVTEVNSVTGRSVGDMVGGGSIQPLSNDRFLVWSPGFGEPSVGAVTLGTPLAPNGEVSAANSAIGSIPGVEGSLSEPSTAWTAGKAIVIPTTQNQVVLLRVAPPRPIRVIPGLGSVVEGDAGSLVLEVPVRLSAASVDTVTVEWVTLFGPGVAPPDPAVPGDDFVAGSGLVTFVPGDVEEFVSIRVNGDEVIEPDEFVVLGFGNPTNAVMGGYWGLGFGVIEDDDSPPVIVPPTP